MKRVPDWLPPLAAALLAAIAMHGAWLVSTAAGYVPDCIPHLDGCTSVSKAARQGAANVLFKALMIPNAFVQVWTWAVAARWIARASKDPGADRGLRPLGMIAGVALLVYAVALGTDGYPADMAEEQATLERVARKQGEDEETVQARAWCGAQMVAQAFGARTWPESRRNLLVGGLADFVAMKDGAAQHPRHSGGLRDGVWNPAGNGRTSVWCALLLLVRPH